MRQKQPPVRCCSFCHKTEREHGVKLISSPQDYPQAFICEGCVAVCASILEDDRNAAPAWSLSRRQEHPQPPEAPPVPPAPPESPIGHPMAGELLERVEQWISREASGHDASAELNRLRSGARLMFVNPDA